VCIGRCAISNFPSTKRRRLKKREQRRKGERGTNGKFCNSRPVIDTAEFRWHGKQLSRKSAGPALSDVGGREIFFWRWGKREPSLPEREREKKREEKKYTLNPISRPCGIRCHAESYARASFLRETSPPDGDSTSDSVGFT